MNLQNNCCAMLKQLHDEIGRRVNNSLRSQNMTFAQMHVLLLLHDAPNHQLPLKDLEALMHVAQSTAAGIVSRLQKKELVQALDDAADQRIKIVQLTESGLTCCQTANKHINETEAALLSGLTETEQVIFLTLLKKLRDTVC